MQRHPLESTAVRSAGYDPLLGELEIEFRSGRVYRYAEVPESVYDWLLRIPNKGAYVSRQIVGRYAERELLLERLPSDPLEVALARSIEQVRGASPAPEHDSDSGEADDNP